MASASDGERPPEPPGTSGEAAAENSQERGRSEQQPAPNPAGKRSALHKPKEGEGGSGYDFSDSYEQRRRVRFKFGVHSLAVEATLAKLFESLTVECRWGLVSVCVMCVVCMCVCVCGDVCVFVQWCAGAAAVETLQTL